MGASYVRCKFPKPRKYEGAAELNKKLFLPAGYKPSEAAKRFHRCPSNYRILIWGIKSGKTYAGTKEIIEYALTHENKLVWVVAPTYSHVETCEYEIERMLNIVEGYVLKHHQAKHTFHLHNGTRIQLRSAEWPDTLRGPNVDFMLIDEGAFIREKAWHICQDRMAATGGDIIITTTPDNRNWLYNEIMRSGIPADLPYGEWNKDDVYMSHLPTWNFAWVKKEHISRMKETRPRSSFDREYGAMFSTSDSQVFDIEDSIVYMDFAQTESKKVMGLDLAKHHDFTALVIMDEIGQVIDVDKWTGIDWRLQKERIKRYSDKYSAAICLDVANIGSALEEDLREMGLMVYPVQLNSPDVKTDLIQSLMIGFEGHHIKIPHPSQDNAPGHTQSLLDELRIYEASLTRGGRVSYNAPQNMHDDLVIALALAYWGKKRGLAGGDGSAQAVASGGVLDKKRQFTVDNHGNIEMQRPNIFKDVFNRPHLNKMFRNTGGRFWG